MKHDSLALCGAAGGAGTTWMTLASGTALARDGHDVAVLDAAYATQGLANRVAGRLEPDMTALCLDDDPLESGLVDIGIDGGGRLAVCPARAPFERLARAKTPEAAQRFESRMAEAARGFDYVLLDTPPVAANQAVAAVTAAERVAIICDGSRAADAVPRCRDRLTDLGVEPTATVITGSDGHPDADVAVPALETNPLEVSDHADVHAAISAVIEATLGIAIEPAADERLRDRLPL